ncbi:MAG: EAL domain-containing protein [Burkholderiaceae bacterium]
MPHWNESDRLAALARYRILDTAPEADYDDIVRLLAEALDVPIAVVNLVAEGRQWFKAEVGLGVRETPLDVSFCAHAILQPGGLVVPDARQDPRFDCNPLVTGAPSLRFYAGELLETPEGLPIGTLCVLDTKPRPQGITAQQRFLLKTLSRQVMAQLELRRAVAEREEALARQYRLEVFQRQIQDSATDHAIISSDLQGRVLSWNAGAVNIFGWRKDEAIGRPLAFIFTPEDVAAGRPGIEMRRALDTGRSPDERWHMKKDGSRFWANGEATLLKDEEGVTRGFVKVLREQTQRHLEQEQLQEAKERFASLIESAGDGLFGMGPDSSCTFINRAGAAMLGYRPEELIGRQLHGIIHHHRADGSPCPLTRCRIFQAAQTGSTVRVDDEVFWRKDGTSFPVTYSTYPIVVGGKNTGAVTTFSDVTQRKRVEALASGQKLALEMAVAGAPLTAVLNTLAHAAEAYADGKLLASVLLLDRDGKHLHFAAGPSLPEAYNRAIDGMPIGPAAGSCGTAAFTGRAVFVSDIGTDPLWKDYRELALGHGLRSCWSVPIPSLRGTVLGVFAFYCRQVRELTVEEIESFPSLVNTAALILDRHRESETRQEVEDALRDAQARLEGTLNAADIGTWVFDLRNDKVYADPNMARLYGVADADADGGSAAAYFARIHPDDVAQAEAGLQRAVETDGRYQDIYRVRRADGQQRFIHVRGRIEFGEDGAPERMAGVSLDITQQKQAEAELRASEERYRTLFELMDQAFCIVEMLLDETGRSVDYRFLELNPAFEAQTGIVGATGKRMRDIAPEHEAHWFETYGRVALTGEPIRFESEAKALHRWFDVYATRIGGAGSRKVAILFTDITERKRTEQRIRQFNETLAQQANYDTLTGLPNRRLFRDRLDQEIRHAESAGRPIALAFIDLDRFKEVNDLLGHDAGDLLLQQAAQRIQECIRPADTVARLGGDEFTVILTDANEMQHVEQIAQRIIDALAQPFTIGSEQARVSGSIGITVYPADARSPEDLIRNADQAMYLSKTAGRNQLSFFQHSMQVAAINRLKLIGELRQAVPGRQLDLYFQPIVELATGRIIKAEALVRWRHPVRGLVLPAEFIGIAEETGLINEIGNWVFVEAATCSKRWSDALGRPFQISINKSPIQFLSQEPLTDWPAHLAHLGVARNSISVEITEGTLLNVTAAISDRLTALQQGGIEVSIDDFGTGYSSMSYLKKMDVDYLKIDQSFVRDMLHDASTKTIAETIIVMAHKLDLKVIAEGVERTEQRDWLLAQGCDYAQGFLFSEPLPADAFERLLLSGETGAPAAPRHRSSS